MNTKIRVEYDFDKKEPYLQLHLNVLPTQTVEMADQMLRELSQQFLTNPVVFIKGEHNNPQLRILTVETESVHKAEFIELFSNFANDLINQTYPSVEQHKFEKTFADFFELIGTCVTVTEGLNS